MFVCGVICEYNPFHRGHAHHLAMAREKSGADFVVCVMSGALTQRGHFARHDKWTRTRMALESGADLVIELPTRFACAPAPEFAHGGVMTLDGLGVVTHLSFGCEKEALPLLETALGALRQETPDFARALREGLDRGLPFPRARALAAEAVTGQHGLADALAAPNLSLALEYLCALPPSMTAVPVAREGAGYHDTALCALPSATAVRAALEEGLLGEALCAVPCPGLLENAENEGRIHAPEALDTALLYRLRTQSAKELSAICGMSEGLEHRFSAAARNARSRDELIHAIKSKRYTYARLSRISACVLLGMTERFARQHPSPEYARVLGFRRSAAPLLSAIKKSGSLPLVTKAADYSSPLFSMDVLAQDLWALGCPSPALHGSGCDYTTSPVIL